MTWAISAPWAAQGIESAIGSFALIGVQLRLCGEVPEVKVECAIESISLAGHKFTFTLGW